MYLLSSNTDVRSASTRTSAAASRAGAPWTMSPSLRTILNLVIVAQFTLLAIASYQRYVSSGTTSTFAVLTVNLLFLGLFLTRRAASDETGSGALWALAYAGTTLPLLMRPAAPGRGAHIGAGLELVGIAMLAIALLSLRRSFGVVPGNRGIRREGMYRLVRHPVYLSELVLLLGVALANPAALNAVIWVGECALQLARARAEERFLAADPLYRAYSLQVRYRLIPWVV